MVGDFNVTILMGITSPSRRPTESADKPKFTILRLVESNRTTTQKTLADDKEDMLSDPMKVFCKELIFSDSY